MSITVVGDYLTGYNQIPQNQWSGTTLQDRIDRVEAKYLKILFGDELYNAYNNDLVDGVPQTQKYIDLRDGISGTYTDKEGVQHLYDGLKGFLIDFVVYDFDSKSKMIRTNAGPVEMSHENAAGLDINALNQYLKTRWNEGVEQYNKAVDFINIQNELIADTYKGSEPVYFDKIYIAGFI